MAFMKQECCWGQELEKSDIQQLARFFFKYIPPFFPFANPDWYKHIKYAINSSANEEHACPL